MDHGLRGPRRNFFRMAGAAGCGFTLAACLPIDSRTATGQVLAQATGDKVMADVEEVLPVEDLFPHFEKAGKLVDLVRTLKEQHGAGRRITATILGLASQESLASTMNHQALALQLQAFIRMYEPHAAREDTVLFPAFRSVVIPKQYDEYGELFEAKEQQLFGRNGFEVIVGQAADLEKSLDIYELNQFMPRCPRS